MMRTPRRSNLPVRALWVISLTAIMSGLGGCHSGALWGAGIGALFGQALGGNTESTVAGAAIGALIGADASSYHHSGYHYYAPTSSYVPAQSYNYNVHYDGDCY